MKADIDVLVSEVGPRDGLNTKQFMPTECRPATMGA
jgi:hypothetical protein